MMLPGTTGVPQARVRGILLQRAKLMIDIAGLDRRVGKSVPLLILSSNLSTSSSQGQASSSCRQ